MIKIGETYSSGSFDDDNEYYLDVPSYLSDFEPEDEFISFVKESSVEEIANFLNENCVPGWFDLFIDGEPYVNIEVEENNDNFKTAISNCANGWCLIWFNTNWDDVNNYNFESLPQISTFDMAKKIKDAVNDDLEVSLNIEY